MKISKRLEKLVEMTPKSECVADIGTDHGYVPMALLEYKKATRVIATDINRKPLEKAMSLADSYNLTGKIDFRQGPGLTVLKNGEVQGVIIAGMGGELIKDMIEISLDIVKRLEFLILQPAQNPEVIREYLYDKNFTILAEDLVREDDGRFYEYFRVVYDEEIRGFSHQPMDFILSPLLLRRHHPLMREYITEKMREIQLIRSKLDLSYASSRIKDRDLESKIVHFQEALKWL
ncbi:MAG: class I SAM-dependent methyltransferase [Clostridiaceae bacterium]